MSAEKPVLHSVWRSVQDEKIIVTSVHDPDEDELMNEGHYLPGYFVVTFVDYDDRFDACAMADEFDNEEWAALLAEEGFVQVGVEPGEYAV